MKLLHNTFEKQQQTPVNLYGGCCCCCCCCILMPIGNLIADKIVVKLTKATKTRWMTVANIAFFVLSTLVSIFTMAIILEVLYIRDSGILFSGIIMACSFYYYLLFWYTHKWLPGKDTAIRVKWSLLQWFLSIIFMSIFGFLSILIVFVLLGIH